MLIDKSEVSDVAFEMEAQHFGYAIKCRASFSLLKLGLPDRPDTHLFCRVRRPNFGQVRHILHFDLRPTF